MVNEIYIPPLNKILSLVDFDEMFVKSPNAKIVNYNNLSSQHVAKDFTDAVFSDLDEEVSFVATCKCGALVGNFYEDTICKQCGSKVSTAFGDRLTHSNWIGIPPEFPPIINPIIYEMLRKWGEPARDGTSIIDCILSPSAKYPDDWTPPITGKGFQYFFDHFDELMVYMFNTYPPTATKKNNSEFSLFLNLHRDKIFCHKLPILHSSLHSSTKSGQMRFVDKSAKEILQAMAELSCMMFIKKKNITNQKIIDSTIFDVLQKCLNYMMGLVKSKLGDKLAIIRHHLLGTRCHFSARAVIIPHTKVHMADEVHMPWKIMVNALKLEIINLLVSRYGYTSGDAWMMHHRSTAGYIPLIDEIMNILIKESPYKGLPVLVGRNPITC